MSTLTSTISDEISRANAAFEAGFERHDAAAIAALYTSNGVLLPTGMEAIEGQAGIRAFWQGAMEMGIKRVKLHTNEVEQLTDTAIEVGQYTLFGPNDQQLDQGKYLVVWKAEAGKWKLHQDIWNTSQSTPAAK